VQLLGAPHVFTDDQTSTPLWGMDAALLALLAIDGPQPAPRLRALLWPDSTPTQAAGNLRGRSRVLKGMAGRPLLQPGSPGRLADGLRDAPPATVPDGIDLAHIANFDDDELCRVGGLLDGVALGDLGDLDAWLADARHRIAQQLHRRLRERAEALERDGRLDEALRLADTLCARCPDDELACIRHVSLLYLQGNRTAALAAYWRFVDRLRAEYATAPGVELQRLAQTIEAAQAPPPGAGARKPPVALQRPPVLVGRQAAMVAMAEAWQRGQAFLVVADAGMGKSRVLEEFIRGRSGVHSLRAQPGDGGIPYALLGRLLVAIDTQYKPALTALQRQELARLRPEFGLAPGTPAYPPLLWQAAEALLAGAHAQGLSALVLDDLHDADAASLEALRWLGGSLALQALRVGLASRPGWSGDAQLAGWLTDSPRPQRIDLRGLSVAELAELLATLALPAQAFGALAERLHRMAGGHPAYSLAALRAALAAGIDLQAAEWPRPSHVETVYDQQLRSLAGDARALLQVAAVAVPDFSAELAAHVLGKPVLALHDAWAALEAAEVLAGGAAFAHDLVHEAALRALPLGIAQGLHLRVARWLATQHDDGAARQLLVQPARIAAHWQAANVPAEAGRWWHAAGEAARTSGRLDEQITLFERAAAAQHQAGRPDAQFEALLARLQALRLRHGGHAVLEALPALDTLAETRAQRLRCALARAEALLDLQRSSEALAVTTVASREAALHAPWRATADALHAYALAQCGDDAGALAASASARAAAGAAHDGQQLLLAMNATQYAHYAAGRLPTAVEWLTRAVVQAEALGDRTAAAETEGEVAATLSAIGDVPGSLVHALACQDRHAALGMAGNSGTAVTNWLVIGNASAAIGRFDQALHALDKAQTLCGAHAAPVARAKAAAAQARLWLRLGRPDLADAAIDAMPADAPPSMRIQAHWARAQAAALAGASPQRHHDALLALVARNPAPSLVNSNWHEWSYACADAPTVIKKLTEVQGRCAMLALVGTANSLRWRMLVCWLGIDGDDATAAALAHARALEPAAAAGGLSAKAHPPQVLETLVAAYRRAGDIAGADRCCAAAFAWLDAAWPHVPLAQRASFAKGDPMHRQWLEARAT
jgi:DNA-binding SARP family transcriptional activator